MRSRTWLPLLGAAMVVVAVALPFARHPASLGLAAAGMVAAVSGIAYLLWAAAPGWTPTLLYAGCLAGFTVVYGLTGDAAIGFFAAASFAVLRPPRRVHLALLAVAVLALNVVQLVTGSETPLTLLATDAGILFFASIGWLLVSERRQRERANLLVAQLAQARRREAEAVIQAERARMARDLHDLLAHTLSGLTVQLEAARVLAADSPEALRTRIETAQRLARSGLQEARGAVGALRGEGISVASVEALVAEHRLMAAGGVSVTVTGTPRELRGDAAMTVYRAVQESLSNVRKHAPGQPAEVALDWSEDALTVTVSNPSPPPTGEPGWGIAGMRERAALIGAVVDAGWDGGRFVLRFELPLGS